MKVELTREEIKSLQKSEIGRLYLEYNNKIGGDMLSLYMVPDPPPGINSEADVIKTYKECIAKGVTWEELLDYHMPDDAIL